MKITLAADTGRAAGRRVPIAPEIVDRSDEDGVVVPLGAALLTRQHDALRVVAGCPAAVTEVRA